MAPRVGGISNPEPTSRGSYRKGGRQGNAVTQRAVLDHRSPSSHHEHSAVWADKDRSAILCSIEENMPIEDFQSIEGVRIQGERERGREGASKDRQRGA